MCVHSSGEKFVANTTALGRYDENESQSSVVLYGVQDESDEPLETTRILSDVEFALIDVSEHTRTFQIGQEVFRSFPSNLRHKNFNAW